MLNFLASFNVVGKDLDPDEVSHILRLEPSKSHRSGDPHYGRGGRYADHHSGLWSLRSPIERDKPLEEHLSHFKFFLKGKEAAIAGLRARGFYVEFFIGVFDIGDGDELSLSVSELSMLAALHADIRFDLYRDDEDEGWEDSE